LAEPVSILKAASFRRRVLVVDDNIDGARMLATLIRTLGHEVDYCINGYAALDLAARVRPYMAFVDLALPDISGWTLAKALRKQPGLEAIRIFAMTGHYGANERDRSLEAGCEDHLIKPLDPAVIIQLLEPDAKRDALRG
jgi:CheY-like chemotaxis protein